MQSSIKTRIIISASVVLLILSGGTLGYMLLEGWSFFESLYMTAITVSTVGYGEIRPLSEAGRIFTITLIFSGVGTVFYILTMVTQVVVEGQMKEYMGRRSLERHIRSLKDHYIVCGYGRIGGLVNDMLRERGVPTVVLDNSSEVIADLEKQGVDYVQGSATDDDKLLAAGIDRAKGLVATVSSDADNVFIVLSAKSMKPDLFIIARSTEPGSEHKLRRAGADKVVSPYFIGARRIAQTVIRPSVADFIDLTFHSSHLSLQMEELKVGPNTELAGKQLKDSGIRQKLDLIIMAVKKSNDNMIFNPQADTVIEVGDTLIALGRSDSMEKLGKILGG